MGDLYLFEQLAREAGFHLYGWTHARPLARYRQWLSDRIASGRAVPGEVTDIDLRLDPSRHLPGARSVWAAAMCYLSDPPPVEREGLARLARFTWGTDYHRVLGERLRGLVNGWERRRGPFSHRICVDTSPVLDRALAVRAGLGFTGKNTCVINPLFGSWLVLGSVITDLPLPEGTSQGSIRPALRGFDPCAGCSRCVDACPAGALAPYRLNGPRCLSHITQSRQEPPAWAVRHLGRSIWGCDVCQEVCPWNQGVRPPSLPEFEAPSPRRAYPDPHELADMTPDEFAAVYGDAALAWRGPDVLRRNARLLLGRGE